MSLILCIDTAVQDASICLAKDGQAMAWSINKQQNESAAWLQPAIQKLVAEQNISLQQLDAIAVSYGPGSYTGLRVSMASAKGLCYALSIPLITVSTLQMMAAAAIEEKSDLLCPMIDARRQEVFTALYDRNLREVLPPQALILEAAFFEDWLVNNTITFFGNGSTKFQPLLQHPNARFAIVDASAVHLASLAHESFLQQAFADVAYCEPFYGKAFYSTAKVSIKQNHKL